MRGRRVLHIETEYTKGPQTSTTDNRHAKYANFIKPIIGIFSSCLPRAISIQFKIVDSFCICGCDLRARTNQVNHEYAHSRCLPGFVNFIGEQHLALYR